MLRPLILMFILFSGKLTAQEASHPSIWYDQFTARDHFTSQLLNIMATRDYGVIWDSLSDQYISAMPKRLTYLPFANQTIEVKMTEVDYRDEYQLQKWELFSPERMDSIFQLGKQVGEVTLKYDELGRLISSDEKLKPKSTYKSRREFIIHYLESDSGSVINMELWSREFYWFARYQSSYAGNFMYRPLRKRSVWKSYNQFDKNGLMSKHISTSASKLNQREGSLRGNYIYDFTWDEKGRLLSESYESVNEEKTKVIAQSSKTRDFSMERDSVLFPLLQVPSIALWINNNFDKKDLNLIEYTGGFKGKSGTFLEHKQHDKLLYLDTNVTPRQVLYQTLIDSNSIYRAVFQIVGHPSVLDTTPYDPDYKSHVIDTRYTQCSIETINSRPPGLIDATKADGFKRSILPLNGGWSMALYQRGASDYPSTRFSVGYPPFIRMDVLNDEYLILDSEGVIRYVGSHQKLAKVN